MNKSDWILLIIANLTVALYCILGFVDSEGVPLVITFIVVADILYLLVVSRDGRP